MPDPNADYWTLRDIADHWGVSYNTVRTYRARGRGELPEPDAVFGRSPAWRPATIIRFQDRKSTRLNSSHVKISYAVFCLKKKKITLHRLVKVVITITHRPPTPECHTRT